MSRVAPPRSMAVAAECRSRLAPFVGAAMPAFPTNLVNAAQNASENKDMHSPNCWRVLYGVFKICLRERAGQRPVTALYYHDKFGSLTRFVGPVWGYFAKGHGPLTTPLRSRQTASRPTPMTTRRTTCSASHGRSSTIAVDRGPGGLVGDDGHVDLVRGTVATFCKIAPNRTDKPAQIQLASA